MTACAGDAVNIGNSSKMVFLGGALSSGKGEAPPRTGLLSGLDWGERAWWNFGPWNRLKSGSMRLGNLRPAGFPDRRGVKGEDTLPA